MSGINTSSTANLFLKCEGHGAFTGAHINSYIHKVQTGQGKTANESLHLIAQGGTISGMQARAAENYSKEYKAVLKLLRLGGGRNTAHDVAVALDRKLDELGVGDSLKKLKRPIGEGAELADAFADVLLPAVQDLPSGNELAAAVAKARPDFERLIKDLRADGDATGRIFAEVKLTPAGLDRSLAKFWSGLGQLPEEDAPRRRTAARSGFSQYHNRR